MNVSVVRSLALSGLLVAGSAAADGFGLGVKAGTLGLGVEGTVGLSERFNLRVGANSYSYKYDETASGVRYDADLDLQSAALLLDWHPFAGTFRMTAGLMHNKNAVHLLATPTEDQTIGDTTYTPAQIGTLSGDVTFKKSVPYAGIGWGNAARRGRFGMSFEIGAMFQDKPEVTLRGDGGAAGSGAFEDDLRREEQEAEADLEDFDVYPVVSLGFSFRF